MSQNSNINFVMSVLNEAGWQPIQTDEYWLLIPTQGRYGGFFISFYFNHRNRMLAARGNIPLYIPKEKELIALKFINYSNYRIPIGNLELDIQSKQAFFRVGMFFEQINLNAQLLHNVVHEISQAVQDFQPAIQAILQDEVSIEDAFRLTNST